MKKRDWKIGLISVGATLGVVLLTILVMYWFSFKIVYDPQVITNWDAVSGVAAWVGILVSVVAVIASIVAIIYAIKVPKEIAEREDRIALFEKRFAVYGVVRNIYSYGMTINTLNDVDEIFSYTKLKFGTSFEDPVEYKKIEDSENILLLEAPLLFPQVNAEDCKKLALKRSEYIIQGLLYDKNEMELRKQLQNEVEIFVARYDAVFQEYIAIKE